MKTFILAILAVTMFVNTAVAGDIVLRKGNKVVTLSKGAILLEKPGKTVAISRDGSIAIDRDDNVPAPRVAYRETVREVPVYREPQPQYAPAAPCREPRCATPVASCNCDVDLMNPPDYFIDGCERFVSLGIYAQVPCCGGNGEVRHVLLCDVRNGNPVGRLVIPPNAVHVGWYLRVQRVRGATVVPWHYYLN